MGIYDKISPVGAGWQRRDVTVPFDPTFAAKGLYPGKRVTVLNGCGGPLAPWSQLDRNPLPESEYTGVAVDDGLDNEWTRMNPGCIPRAHLLMGAACLVQPADYVLDGINVQSARHAWDERGLYGNQPQITTANAGNGAFWGVITPASQQPLDVPCWFGVSVRISVSDLNFQTYRANFSFPIANQTDANGDQLLAALPGNFYNGREASYRGINAANNTQILQIDVFSPLVELYMIMFTPRFGRVAPIVTPAAATQLLVGTGAYTPYNTLFGANFVAANIPATADVTMRIAGYNTDLAGTHGNILSGAAALNRYNALRGRR